MRFEDCPAYLRICAPVAEKKLLRDFLTDIFIDILIVELFYGDDGSRLYSGVIHQCVRALSHFFSVCWDKKQLYLEEVVIDCCLPL